MARQFLTPIDLAKNELQNAKVQNLGSPPAATAADKGLLYFNSTDNTMYWYDGALWVAAKSATTGFGNVVPETTFGLASANGVATTSARSDHTHGSPVHDAAAHSTFPLNTFAPATNPISMGGYMIHSVQDPTAAQDAATKSYVDSVASGLDVRTSVRAASTAQVTTTGPQTVDGVSLIAGDRVLLKNQASTPLNGIFVVAAGAWGRAADMNTWDKHVSAFTFVESGTTQADTGWVCTVDPGGTLGTTAITWSQFSGGAAIVAGEGLTQTGNTIDVGMGAGISLSTNAVAVLFGGTGGVNTAARSDHNHDTTYPPMARSIATTAPLTGGGDLSANRTLAITNFAGSAAGAVPVSVGGAVNFLRADGTWAAPALDTTAGDTRYTRKYATDVGGATSQVITHNLGTEDVDVTVYRKGAPKDEIVCDVQHTSTTTVTLLFAVAPAAASLRVVVHG